MGSGFSCSLYPSCMKQFLLWFNSYLVFQQFCNILWPYIASDENDWITRNETYGATISFMLTPAFVLLCTVWCCYNFGVHLCCATHHTFVAVVPCSIPGVPSVCTRAPSQTQAPSAGRWLFVSWQEQQEVVDSWWLVQWSKCWLAVEAVAFCRVSQTCHRWEQLRSLEVSEQVEVLEMLFQLSLFQEQHPKVT
jgi:hypothetical protein